MPDESNRRARGSKFHRARMRKLLLTKAPNRLSRGRLKESHLSQDIVLQEIDVASALWPEELSGLRIGHVSDFHLGDLMPLDRAIATVERLASLKPDVIVCTGDVVDLHASGAEPLFEAMVAADAPLGALLVLGNHDQLDDERALIRMAEREGVAVLQNDLLRLDFRGAQLNVAGIDWGKTLKQNRRHVDRTCDDPTHLLLAHNPKAFRRACEVGVPLTLAGHTHGGQIAVKNRPGTNLAVAHRHSAGLYSRGESHLFVTTGAGAWFPFRMNCPAEIALVTVHSRTNGENS